MATSASDLLGAFLTENGGNAEGLDSDFLAGGGADQAQFILDFFRETETAERGRTAGGLDLARMLLDLQRDPSNFAAAIQAQGMFGGNAATAAAASGGKVTENPNNALFQALLGGIGEFALGDGNLPAGTSPGQTSSAQAQHNATVAQTGQTNKADPSGGVQAASAGASVFDSDTASGEGGIGNPVVSPSIDRALLPDNVQAAIKLFEDGQGNTIDIGQAVQNHGITKLNEENVTKIAAGTTPPTQRGLSRIEAMFDKSTLEGGSTITNPDLIAQTIRSAIGKRQTKKGARNQVLSSAVGRAVNGASN